MYNVSVKISTPELAQSVELYILRLLAAYEKNSQDARQQRSAQNAIATVKLKRAEC